MERLRLNKEYRNNKLIGEGGNANVYLKKRIDTGKDVAVKVLQKEISEKKAKFWG